MPNLLLDDALILVPIGTTLTSSQTYAARPAAVSMAPPCAWILAISSVANGPVYTFTLEWSDTVSGTYATLASFALPAIAQAANLSIGVSGGMLVTRRARWLRLAVDIAGGGRNVVFGSGLTLLRTEPGLAARGGAAVPLP